MSILSKGAHFNDQCYIAVTSYLLKCFFLLHLIVGVSVHVACVLKLKLFIQGTLDIINHRTLVDAKHLRELQQCNVCLRFEANIL